MKKVWNSPVMEELNVNATADGSAPVQEADGPIYQDSDGKYKVDLGVKGLSPDDVQ